MTDEMIVLKEELQAEKLERSKLQARIILFAISETVQPVICGDNFAEYHKRTTTLHKTASSCKLGAKRNRNRKMMLFLFEPFS